ncbi:hypothetical protein F8568_030345 [Actinomadura sp. LD22]|uniref:SAF domain-containing protein n=1 Tax=Actinomadura physcomitrii TaxID=2650748 RepID=A0A6I4MFY7_9ACTN|nr:hypothetical protein [Actinomadura physcomitrii]MWA04603.1 hypothetical protein [Actinomadura physcomitrii]
MVIAVIANVYLVEASGNRVAVVRLARDVPMNRQIAKADLAVTKVAVDSTVATVPGHQLGEVVGRRAAVGLRKGSLLAATQLAAGQSPPSGKALVTVPLKSGTVPPGLAPGWQVRVVFTTGSQDQPSEEASAQSRQVTRLRDVPAVVDQVDGPDEQGAMSVSLQVNDSDSSAVARQAAAGLVVLVVTGRNG